MTDQRFEACARILAAEAKDAPRSPGRSVAALVRHRLSGETEDTRAQLRHRALQLLEESTPAGAPDSISWLTLAEAARRLRTSERAIKRALHSAAGRRAYGWPQWRGHRWWIAYQVTDSALAPAFFAALPREEPWPADMLPPWVEVEES